MYRTNCRRRWDIDHEGEIPESYMTRTRDKEAALRSMKKALKRQAILS